jgi:hypothetical protein
MKKKFIKFLKNLFCRHYSRTHIRTDFNEGYVKYICNDCRKEIFIDMDTPNN